MRTLALLSILLPTVAFAAPAKHSVVGITAHLFHDQTGKFDEVSIADGAELWCVGVGEDPSNRTLILVEVAGEEFSAKSPKLTVKVTEGTTKRRQVLKQTIPLRGFSSKSGKVYVPILVPSTGWDWWTITASLPGSKETKTAQIKFICGE